MLLTPKKFGGMQNTSRYLVSIGHITGHDTNLVCRMSHCHHQNPRDPNPSGTNRDLVTADPGIKWLGRAFIICMYITYAHCSRLWGHIGIYIYIYIQVYIHIIYNTYIVYIYIPHARVYLHYIYRHVHICIHIYIYVYTYCMTQTLPRRSPWCPNEHVHTAFFGAGERSTHCHHLPTLKRKMHKLEAYSDTLKVTHQILSINRLFWIWE